MSNLGFTLAMKAAGIGVVHANVGDRYVLEAMRAQGIPLGGEQSGHLILTDHATTGDGVLAALKVAGEMASSNRSLTELAGVVTRLPQVLVNVPGVHKELAGSDPELQERDSRGRDRAGRHGARAAAPLRHRAAGPSHGRGAPPATRPTPSPTGSPTSSAPASPSDSHPTVQSG